MITRFKFGCPFETGAVEKAVPEGTILPDYLQAEISERVALTVHLGEEDLVYGLGENVRGINKRGWIYESRCSDEKDHHEDTVAMYCAHNFLVVAGGSPFGLFVDYPGIVTFDVGYTRLDTLRIETEGADLWLYVIEGESPLEIVRQFRKLIGRSYLAPFWAFGYQQCRWGYGSEKDVEEVARRYQELSLPLDSIGLDIDYMERYKDFTVDREGFPDFEGLVRRLLEKGIHLVPIIDAAVKIEDGYEIYEEGVKGRYFCQREDGSDFVAGVWPGRTHFPDVLNDEAREWFGSKYKRFLDMGIEGFWNDMNEPAIFYSEEELEKAWEKLDRYRGENLDVEKFFELEALFPRCLNNREDYKRFYHHCRGKRVRHDKVHNLYGYYMTKAADESFRRMAPERRILLFSRSSYIGMHRHGGIWMGDNKAWWSHILLNLKMLPSLNMCGFLFVGADLGGFACNTTKDLMLRWLALGVFTPLMRNHAKNNTRRKECYQFEDPEDFRGILRLRYALLPYLYSEYMKAALEDDMMFRPLAFDYPEDERARRVEDQLMLGEGLMIAPVYEQNAVGRYVYLPEDMLLVTFESDESYRMTMLPKGDHYIPVSLKEVPLFIRKGHLLPLARGSENTGRLNQQEFTILGYRGVPASYQMYEDDGYTRTPEKDGWYTEFTVDQQGEAKAGGKTLHLNLL